MCSLIRHERVADGLPESGQARCDIRADMNAQHPPPVLAQHTLLDKPVQAAIGDELTENGL